MSFTIADAITRLDGGPRVVWRAGLSSGQKLQRINEVLEIFYTQGSWRGLHDIITLTSVGGIVTLPAGYQRLDGRLAASACGGYFDLKSQAYGFVGNGPNNQDWSLTGLGVAIDLGDTAGQRRYQLSGNATTNDALTLQGYARRRYVWATDTATVVVPDSYVALRKGVYALGREDEADDSRAGSKMSEALAELDSDLREWNGPDWGTVQIDASIGMGMVENLQ